MWGQPQIVCCLSSNVRFLRGKEIKMVGILLGDVLCDLKILNFEV